MGARNGREQVENDPNEFQQSSEESFKAALWLKMQKYDFNFDHDDLASTIQSTFTVDWTNDLGEQIIPHIAHMIEMEFRRFMFINFLSILVPDNHAKFEKEVSLRDSNFLITFVLVLREEQKDILYYSFLPIPLCW